MTSKERLAMYVIRYDIHFMTITVPLG